MIPIVGPLISLISTGVSAYAEHKKLQTQQKTALEQKRLDRIEKMDANDAEWDKIQANNANESWKDEWFTILLSIPAILCFIPGMDIYVVAGFKALEQTPDWYKYAFIVAVAASFGFKKITDYVGKKNGA